MVQLASARQEGYATASTDTGHVGRNASFAIASVARYTISKRRVEMKACWPGPNSAVRKRTMMSGNGRLSLEQSLVNVRTFLFLSDLEVRSMASSLHNKQSWIS